MVINLSNFGALLEGVTRLLPNTHTDLHIVTRHGRVLVRARVVRAFVWQLERDMVCYRTALAFDSSVDTEVAPSLSERKEPSARAPDITNGYYVPVEIPGNSGATGTGYPNLDLDDRG